MLTGERPAGTDLPSDLNPAVPKHLDEAFRRSYARLDKRFASAEEFADGAGAARTAAHSRRTGPRGRRDAVPLPVPPVPGHATGRERTAGRRGRRTARSAASRWTRSDQFCMHCGVQLVENVRRCPQCGAYPDGD